MNEEIRRNILNDITAENYRVIGITLTCSEETLLERHRKRGDPNECSFFWLHLPAHPGDYVVNTDGKSVREVVDEIRGIIDSAV